MAGTANVDVTVTLRLPPNAAHVRTARLIAAAMARRSGVGEDVLDEVRLAVGEACARAVRVQERQGVAAPVTLEFGETGRFSVSVLDRARPAPATNSPPSPAAPVRRLRGPTPVAIRSGSPCSALSSKTSTSSRMSTVGRG